MSLCGWLQEWDSLWPVVGDSFSEAIHLVYFCGGSTLMRWLEIQKILIISEENSMIITITEV